MTDENKQAEGKPGRPSLYTEELADTICERIADGESLRSICDDDSMPSKSTVLKWLSDEEKVVFRTKYARAREIQADILFDEMLDIADDGRNDWVEKRSEEGDNLGWRENGEALRRSDLRIKTRQWMASKLLPKKYGDRQQVEHSGSNGGPIQTQTNLVVDQSAIESAIAKLKGL